MFSVLSKQVSFRSRWLRLLLLFSLVFTLTTDIHTFATESRKTEILWDTYGVPHIYALDTKDLFYAFGWAQMQSHGNLILRLYGQARGQAAEYWGEDYIESDKWLKTMGVPERARQWYEMQNPTFRGYLDAFAAGINTYAKEHVELIDDEVETVLPVQAVDVLAHLQHVLHFTFVVTPARIENLYKQQQISHHAAFGQKMGSNGWAIAPSRSASGNAMLLANPHLPWSNLFLWYEAQLTAPGIDAYGAALVGLPVLNIAFNDYQGWTHTVNTYDGWDAYELTLANGGYQFDGKVQAFEIEEHTLKVRQADGILRQEPLIVRRSVHGPIVVEKDGKAIALRVVGLDQPGALEEWWDMARAKNLDQFEAALKRLQIPMFTVMYADRDGHVLHLFNGQVPVRTQGDFESWSRIIPGNTSATLWTKVHSYRELPRVLDPPSGWLQNTNDPPWSTTFPRALAPDNYPPYMAPPSLMAFRQQRSARMLVEDEQISFEEMVKYKHSTRMELADRLLDELIVAAQQRGGKLARQAAEVLKSWDRKADADSSGAVLFAFWAQAVDLSSLFAIPWDQNSPLATPDGLANPASAVTALEVAATQVEATYGRLDVPWGDVFRLRVGDLDLPANGGADELGIFRMLWFIPSEDQRFEAAGGDSYVAAIEFSNPVRAMALISYGNSTQPGLLNKGKQLKLFGSKRLRPIWRSRQEIEAHLAFHEALQVGVV